MTPVRALTVALALIVAGCNGNPDTDTDNEETDTDEAPDLANGKSVHDVTCLSCHDGTTGAPDLAEVIPDKSDAEIESAIRNGQGDMPPQTHLTNDDIRDVLAYLRATYE